MEEAVWNAKVGEGTLDAKWEDWCRRAEDYLAEATGVGAERGFRGRGRGLITKRQSMVRKLQARQKGGTKRQGWTLGPARSYVVCRTGDPGRKGPGEPGRTTR